MGRDQFSHGTSIKSELGWKTSLLCLTLGRIKFRLVSWVNCFVSRITSAVCCSRLSTVAWFFISMLRIPDFFFQFEFLVTAVSGRPKPEICPLPGRFGWTLLPKECYGSSLSGRGSTTQPSNWEADTLPLSYRSFWHTWSFACFHILLFFIHCMQK